MTSGIRLPVSMSCREVSLTYQYGTTLTAVWTHNAIELLAGFDQATSEGTAAVPVSGELGLVSVSNISFPIVLENDLGGGYSPTSGLRPYGVHLALGTALGTTMTATSPVGVATITIQNTAIPTGESYNMTIWNAGQGYSWTSYIPMFSDVLRDASTVTLTVNSIANTATQYSIGQFKALANNQVGELANAVVTVDVGDSFFVETTDRIAGIRVAKLGTEVYTPGESVTVTGPIETNANGERYIASTAITTAAGSTIIRPLGMVNKILGGANSSYNSSTGAGQAGVTSGTGLNNVGLLVHVWGKPVLTSSTNSFQIQDGSGKVVTVQLPAGQTVTWTAENLPAYVFVTGASGLTQTDSVITPAIYINSFSSDVMPL